MVRLYPEVAVEGVARELYTYPLNRKQYPAVKDNCNECLRHAVRML